MPGDTPLLRPRTNMFADVLQTRLSFSISTGIQALKISYMQLADYLYICILPLDLTSESLHIRMHIVS